MPLTSAERSRRYREKLKRENPEFLKAQRLKNLQRTKFKKKKISEMTELEAEKKRKAWREEKKNSRQKKRNRQDVSVQDSNIAAHSSNNDPLSQDITTTLTSQSHQEKMVKNVIKKNRYLINKCRRFASYLKKLEKQRENYKKRCQRQELQKKQEINDLKTEVMKLKARQEILELTLKKTYHSCSTQSQKQTLKKLVKNSKNKKFIKKMLGLKSKIKSNKKPVTSSKITEIIDFFMRDDVSRNTAGKKETRTKNKSKKQIRYLCDTLVNTFKKYKSEGGYCGFTTFFQSKPFFILSPGLNSRNTCLCPKHSNIDFLHTALLKQGIISGTRTQAMETICCDTNNYNCMYHTCRQCKDKKVQFNPATEDRLNQKVEWLQWERKEHMYEKKEEGTKKEVKTVRTQKVTHEGSINDLKKKYENDLILFKRHYFNNIHQQKEYQKAISDLQENECLIVCDFSESYEAKLANEVQSMHFGASKRQISLHTGMIYWKGEAQSFCTLSDETNHQPPAIWAHLSPVIEMIKAKTPNIEILHFYTDGPSSQYRQKNNFYLLTHFTKAYGFKYTTWSFYEAHHGKSVADGIGGVMKRNLDKKVCLGIDITNAKDAYEVSLGSLKKTKVFLIQKCDIDNISKILPAKLPVLRGTMQLHQVITEENDKTKIRYRDVSCFCGDLKGQCNCFSPKFHSVIELKPRSGSICPLPISPLTLDEENFSIPMDLQDCTVEPLFESTSPLPTCPTTSAEENCVLPMDLKDCPVKPFLCNQAGNAIDGDETPLTTLQQEVQLLPNSKRPISKIKILNIKRYFPQENNRVPLKSHNHSNKVIRILSQGRITLQCEKCSTSISTPRYKCMICEKFFCTQCVGQQIYPDCDYICDPCLES